MKMPPNKKLFKLVKNLNSMSKKQLHYVLNLIDNDTIDMFKEIFMNLNYNTLGLENEKSKKMFEEMKKNKEICEALASSDTSPRKMRQYLKRQAGSGFLTLALSVLAPAIASLISTATSKK